MNNKIPIIKKKKKNTNFIFNFLYNCKISFDFHCKYMFKKDKHFSFLLFLSMLFFKNMAVIYYCIFFLVVCYWTLIPLSLLSFIFKKIFLDYNTFLALSNKKISVSNFLVDGFYSNKVSFDEKNNNVSNIVEIEELYFIVKILFVYFFILILVLLFFTLAFFKIGVCCKFYLRSWFKNNHDLSKNNVGIFKWFLKDVDVSDLSKNVNVAITTLILTIMSIIILKFNFLFYFNLLINKMDKLQLLDQFLFNSLIFQKKISIVNPIFSLQYSNNLDLLGFCRVFFFTLHDISSLIYKNDSFLPLQFSVLRILKINLTDLSVASLEDKKFVLQLLKIMKTVLGLNTKLHLSLFSSYKIFLKLLFNNLAFILLYYIDLLKNNIALKNVILAYNNDMILNIVLIFIFSVNSRIITSSIIAQRKRLIKSRLHETYFISKLGNKGIKKFIAKNILLKLMFESGFFTIVLVITFLIYNGAINKKRLFTKENGINFCLCILLFIIILAFLYNSILIFFDLNIISPFFFYYVARLGVMINLFSNLIVSLIDIKIILIGVLLLYSLFMSLPQFSQSVLVSEKDFYTSSLNLIENLFNFNGIQSNFSFLQYLEQSKVLQVYTEANKHFSFNFSEENFLKKNIDTGAFLNFLNFFNSFLEKNNKQMNNSQQEPMSKIFLLFKHFTVENLLLQKKQLFFKKRSSNVFVYVCSLIINSFKFIFSKIILQNIRAVVYFPFYFLEYFIVDVNIIGFNFNQFLIVSIKYFLLSYFLRYIIGKFSEYCENITR